MIAADQDAFFRKPSLTGDGLDKCGELLRILARIAAILIHLAGSGFNVQNRLVLFCFAGSRADDIWMSRAHGVHTDGLRRAVSPNYLLQTRAGVLKFGHIGFGTHSFQPFINSQHIALYLRSKAMRQLLTFLFFATGVANLQSQRVPPAESFRVLPNVAKGPRVTAYLKYQTEMAWSQDEQRRKEWEGIQTEQDLLNLQQQLRTHLLKMLGGQPIGHFSKP